MRGLNITTIDTGKEIVKALRVNNDINGNPRYVVHFLDIDSSYDEALKRAKKVGGRKYRAKDFGGGIVFQSYNIEDTIKTLLKD